MGSIFFRHPTITTLSKVGIALAIFLGATVPATVSFAQQGLFPGNNCRQSSRCLRYVITRNRAERGNIYLLRVPGENLLGVLQKFSIRYPDEFIERGGSFDQADVELYQGHGLRGGAIPVGEFTFDPEQNRLTIVPQETIPAGTDFTIKLSKVFNPRLRISFYNFLLLGTYQDGFGSLIGYWNVEVGTERPIGRN